MIIYQQTSKVQQTDPGAGYENRIGITFGHWNERYLIDQTHAPHLYQGAKIRLTIETIEDK